MVTRRSPEEVRENDIVHFIVTVRKLVTNCSDAERTVRRIRNLANTMFRHYIGYTARGEYRLKARGERCFKDDLDRFEESGRVSPLRRMTSPGPVDSRLRYGEGLVPAELLQGDDVRAALQGVEFVELEIGSAGEPGASSAARDGSGAGDTEGLADPAMAPRRPSAGAVEDGMPAEEPRRRGRKPHSKSEGTTC